MTDTPRYPTVHVDVSTADAEIASSMLWDLGATGIEERDAETLANAEGADVMLVAFFDSEEDAAHAIAELAPRSARLVFIEGDDWKERWKEFFKPTRVGRRIVVRPSWEPFEAGPSDVVITLDPGQAFGTGTHETTRLVLEEIDELVAGGERVLDVGCGSGILSIGALLLGAKEAVAIDTDPIAVDVTKENAAINEVSDRVHASTTPIEAIEGTYDLVVANIQKSALVPMAPLLIAKTSDALVLSGLLVHEEQEVRAAYAALPLIRRRVQGDWLALRFAKAGA